jgi:hypothetical protein
MKKLLIFILLVIGSFVVQAQKYDVIIYKNWTSIYNNNCESATGTCIDFYYAITRTNNKVYNPQDGQFYYYYYLMVQSNSTYSNGTWAYTKLDGVSFYLNGVQVYHEPYVLFREQKTICIFWHPTYNNARIDFKWKNTTVY